MSNPSSRNGIWLGLAMLTGGIGSFMFVSSLVHDPTQAVPEYAGVSDVVAMDAMQLAQDVLDRVPEPNDVTQSPNLTPPAGVMSDDSWQAFPRLGSGSITRKFAFTAGLLKVEDLYRSADLNPGDVKLEDTTQSRLAKILTRYQSALSKLRQKRDSTVAKESKYLVEQGLALEFEELSTGDLAIVEQQLRRRGDGLADEERSDLRRRLIEARHHKHGRNNFYTAPGGRKYVFATHDMPVTGEIEQIVDYLEAEFFSEVIREFIRAGAADENMHAKLLSNLFELEQRRMARK